MIIDPQLGITMATGLKRRIGRSIIRGDYENKPFPCEADLALLYKSSRTVTREAIKLLTSKGLLSSRPRAGTRVEPVANWNLLDDDIIAWVTENPFSPQIYSKFIQTCLAIEPMAASLAAQLADKAQVAAIGENLRALHEAATAAELINAQVAFHLGVLKASNNPFFWRLKSMTEGALRKSFEIAGTTAYIDPSHYDAVFSAIRDGEASAAELATKWLLTTIANKVKQYDFEVAELPIAIC